MSEEKMMNSMSKKHGSCLKMSVAIFLLAFFAVGCSSDKELQRINREQTATIQSLNGEIARLNHELDSLLKSRDEQAQSSAAAGSTQQARKRYIK